jgi:serine acetyltransferase
MGASALIREDYRAFSRLRGDGSAVRRRLLFVSRVLINPSLQASILVRFSNGSPAWLHWLWRNILIWKHSMDISYRSEIGLFFPHPHTITMVPGVRIRERCRISHMTTIGGNAPILGDGAGAWVDSDMPAGTIAVADKAAIVEGKAEALFGPAGTLPY